MLEIFFLLFVVPKRVSPLARERGRSPFLWSLAASGAWIATEVLLLVFAFSVVGLLMDTGELGFFVFLMYLVPLFAGMFAADQVRKRLESLPAITDQATIG